MANAEVLSIANAHLERLLRENGLHPFRLEKEPRNDLFVRIEAKGHPPTTVRMKVKANPEERFEAQQKWDEDVNLLIVYAWNVTLEAADLYFLTYRQAVELLKERGHTKTHSWNDLKGYSARMGLGERRRWWENRLKQYRLDGAALKKKLASFAPNQ